MGKTVGDEDIRFSVIINGDPAQKELYQLEKRNRSLKDSTTVLKKEKALLEAQGKKNSQAYKELSAKITANNKEVKENASRMRELQKEIGVTGLTLRQLGQRASWLRLQMSSMLPKDPRRKQFKKELEEITAQMNKLSFRSKAAQSSISKLANGFNKYAALGASIIATGTGLILSAQKIIDYNGQLADSQSNVQKTTGLTAKEVDELTKKFGTFKTRTARIELLKLAEEAGRLGKTGVNDVLSFVKVANQIKVALGDDLGEEQIREVGKMVTIYKVAEKEGKNFEEAMLALGSSINEVSASGANQASFLVDFIKRTAGISDVANISAQDMIGLAAAFDEAGQSQEISATAINKFFGSAADNIKGFAEIAGVSIKEYSRLLEEDANDAMILFLKGLKEGNPSLEEMQARLKGIELGGTRGAQAITALASNIENLEAKQSIANNSLKEATSLTNEYNLKNNNLAATLDKVKKRFQAAFSSDIVTGTLAALTNMFGRLIGAITDVNEAFKEETKVSYESAKANRQLANESQNLLNRYNELTADGVEPTKEAKEELDLITLQLKDRLGESVMSINQETGAYILNTEAVKEQIKIKRLAADEEASTMASRLKGVQERKKELSEEQKLAQKEYDLRKKYYEEQNKADIEAFKNSSSLSAMEEMAMLEKSEGAKELAAARRELQRVNAEINEQTERELDLTRKLEELNFSASDIDALFETQPQLPEDPIQKPTNDLKTTTNKNTKTKVSKAKNEADELLQLQRETEDKRLAIIQDAFIREMALNDESQRRKIADLSDKALELSNAYDKAILAGNTDLASTLLDQYNEVLDQMDLEEQIHVKNRAEILENGIQDHIEKLKERYQKEETERQIAHNNELAALGDNEEAKKALQDKFNKEKLEREKEAALELKDEINKILNTEDFKGFDLEVLTEDQKKAIETRLQDLGFSLSEIDKLLSGLKNGGNQEEVDILGATAGNIDIFGFSVEDWEQTFSNLDTTKGKMEAVLMTATGMLNAYKMFSDFQAQNEAKRVKKLEREANKEKSNQDRLLSNKLISEQQHRDAVNAIDRNLEKQKEELAKKQAKRDRITAMAGIALNTAQAIMSIWAQVPKVDFGISAGLLTAFVSALGAAQLVAASKVKGYEKGFYDNTVAVRRQQDGKVFNAAYGGESRSGVVDKPTMFLAGEGGKNFPELIISGPDLKQFDPNLKQSLYREIGRIKGYEEGYYKNVEGAPINDDDRKLKMMMISALERYSDVLERLEENGLEAYVTRNFTNAKRLRDDINRLEKIESKSKINT